MISRRLLVGCLSAGVFHLCSGLNAAASELDDAHDLDALPSLSFEPATQAQSPEPFNTTSQFSHAPGSASIVEPVHEAPSTGTPTSVAADPSQPVCKPSRAVNLAVTKALKRPPTNNPLDSHTFIAGVRCHEDGWTTGDYLLTDTPEFRRLASKGFDLTLTYYPDLTWSSFGTPAYTAMYIGSIDLYTGKTGFMWPGGQFHFTTAGFTGLSYPTSANHSVRFESGGPNDDFRVFEIWYGHKIAPEVELRIGKIYPWVKFAAHQSSGIFQNLIFDYPGVYGTTTTTGNFLPYATTPLGLQLIYNPNPHHQFLLNVADGKDDPSGGYDVKLSDVKLTRDDGVEILAEYAFLDHSKDPKKLPGYYKIGFQGNTGLFTDFRTGLQSRGNYGGYVTLEKMIYAEPDVQIPRSQGLHAFAKFSNVWGDNSIVNVVASLGLSYAGLFPGRDHDMAGIGLGYSRFNSSASQYYSEILGGNPSPSETVLEAVYLAQLTPWLMLIGSYQYIIDPSALGSEDPGTQHGHVFLLNTRLAF